LSFGFEIDHVQIAIPKGGEDIGRAFFGECLGLLELPKPADMAKRGGCWFVAGDRQIHLGVDADFRPALKAHVALKTGKLDELRARLEKAGYRICDETDVEGRTRFFTHDPFGNRIEFMDREFMDREFMNSDGPI
jgi:catechol 2,3-dioxygenase-like lactoylglutathione lyase family enzyme